MIIKTLQISNFRNLEQVSIRPHPVLNVLQGANGAGKTSVLESLVVLSRGRSFRTTQSADLVGKSSRTFQIFAESEDSSNTRYRMGLERSGKRWRGRLDGKDLSQLSQLTRLLPTVLMEPDSHLLISGSPDVRRKYLDWGLFHVKHDFLDNWRAFSKLLKQRNAALRRPNTEVLDTLDDMLGVQGEKLSDSRAAFTESITLKINPLIENLNFKLADLGIEYKRGWRGERYADALRQGRGRDIERGQTQEGPHRSDLLFKTGGIPARAVLSRGEQKMLAVALLMAQADILLKKGERPLLLLDDLVSEFDTAHFERALHQALESGLQVWLTGTGTPALDCPHKLFHVEQGQVLEVV